MSAAEASAEIAGAPPATQIYFCPKGDRTVVLRRPDIPAEKRKRIAELQRLNRWWNWVIPFHFGLWLCAGWLAVRSQTLALDIACFVVGGVALSTLSVLAHESSHNLLTRKPKIDRFLGLVCGLPLLFSTGSYRVEHSAHHARLRTPEDPNDIEKITTNPRLLRWVYVLLFFLAGLVFLVHVPIYAYRIGSPRQRKWVLLEVLLIVACAAAAWTFLPSRVMVKAWVFPMLIGLQIANLRGLAEHGMTSTGNEFIDARTVATSRFIGFFMCNINYHLEHHLYPAVPWYNLPKVHALLKDEYRAAGASWYTSYFDFLRDMARAVRQGVVPGMRVIPGRLRREICF